MVSRSKLNFDLGAALADASNQFRGLNRNEPGQWPVLPKLASYFGVMLAVVVVGWFSVVSPAVDELQGERDREPGLKADYRAKLSQAVNLGELRKQKLQVQEYVTQLEKQLPGKAEMDALLSDINQAGLGRGLQFELFRPGQVSVKDYYAELPITIRVSGRYHDIGAFAGDVANLSRIVTLHNLTISGSPSSGAQGVNQGLGNLSMDATARTYRYLDSSEIEAQRKVQVQPKKAKR